MRADRLLKFMASTMNASESTVQSMCGVIAQRFSITWLLLQSLIIRFSVFMEVSPPL